MDSLTDQGVAALRAGDAATARALLAAAVRERPDDARAWLWLSGALSDPAQQRECLERALALDPASEAARRGLEELGGEIGGLGDWEIGARAERGAMASGSVGAWGREEAGVEPPVDAQNPGGDPGGRAAHRAVATATPWLAAALAGVSALLGWAAAVRLGEASGPPAILAAAVIGGVPLGLVTLVLGGVLLRTSGGWLGGGAGASQVRGALGWAAAPAAWGLLLWGAQLWLLPAATFGGAPTTAIGRGAAAALALAHAALWLWSATRSVVGLAAAHGFGPVRAVAAWLLAALLVAAAAFAVLGCSAFVIGLRGG